MSVIPTHKLLLYVILLSAVIYFASCNTKGKCPCTCHVGDYSQPVRSVLANRNNIKCATLKQHSQQKTQSKCAGLKGSCKKLGSSDNMGLLKRKSLPARRKINCPYRQPSEPKEVCCECRRQSSDQIVMQTSGQEYQPTPVQSRPVVESTPPPVQRPVMAVKPTPAQTYLYNRTAETQSVGVKPASQDETDEKCICSDPTGPNGGLFMRICINVCNKLCKARQCQATIQEMEKKRKNESPNKHVIYYP